MPTVETLLQACRVLFGADIEACGSFLQYLQMGGIKAAYRRRALETHPDQVLGRKMFGAAVDNAAFVSVQQAYAELSNFIESRDEGGVPEEVPLRADCRSGREYREVDDNADFRGSGIGPLVLPGAVVHGPVASSVDRLYAGCIPRRKLLFGHFLYFSGLTNWRTIARILIWQRMGRPRVGELGCRLGMFRQEDLIRIAKRKVPSQRFGQVAKDMGMIDECQLRELLARQRGLQKKFGMLLVENNLVCEEELRILLARFIRHNATL